MENHWEIISKLLTFYKVFVNIELTLKYQLNPYYYSAYEHF